MEIEKRSTAKKILKFKPIKIPSGFAIVIDTREQHPLFLPRPRKGLLITRDKLETGDYSIKGFEDKICVERKQMSDLCAFVGTERDRTIKKLIKMKEMDFAALVIESKDPYDIPDYSQITIEHLRGFFKSCRVKYGIHIKNGSRATLERFILDNFTYYYRLRRKGYFVD